MSFIEEIKKMFNIAENVPCFRAILFGNEALYLESVESIKSFTPNKVEVITKRGCVTICGENLYIKKYCGKDLAVCGKIKSITN